MAGIYLHIPLCKQACHYCDFHFSTTLKNRKALLNAIKKEIAQRKDELNNTEISTIYFGGGTPSLLSQGELTPLLEELEKRFSIADNVEITLEANPDDLSDKKLAQLKAIGINRLSIGVQSFFDEDLRFMNRSHNAEEALASITNAKDQGFNNINIDLIYGTPTLSTKNWDANIATAIELNVPHISAYCLTVEKGTALAHFVKTGKVKNVDDHMAVEQFQILMTHLRNEGLLHYEISNFAKEGFISQHNRSYWNGVHYIGLGPSAHSFNGTNRRWNISNNNAYVNAIESQESFFETEFLSRTDHFNEYVMTSLRTMWGCDLTILHEQFPEFADTFLREAKHHLDAGNMSKNVNVITLTDSGKLLADQITSNLFAENF